MLTLAVLSLSLRGMPQTITFDQLPIGKGVVKNSVPRFIGYDGQNLVLLQYTGRLKSHLELVRYNSSLQEQQRIPLNKDKGHTCHGGYINGNYIDLLQSVNTGNGLHVYRDRRSLQTLQTVDTSLTLARFAGEKDDFFSFSTSVSPNGKLLAGVSISKRIAQEPEMKIGLYDHQLEEYWTQTIACVNASNVSVTDQGDIILYSLYDKGECHFTILDGEETKNIKFKLPDSDPIIERTLLRYGNGNILIATAVQQENHLIMPAGSNIDRVDIYCYNIQKKKLSVTRHPFTLTEVNRLTNSREDKKQNHSWVQFGNICQTLSDSTGAYLILDQFWSTSTNNVITEIHRMGMMVLRVDSNGNILWSTAKRLSNNIAWNKSDFIAYRWLPTPTGIMLAWVDHLNNATLPMGKPVKAFTLFKHPSALNVWSLTSDGHEDQSFIELNRQVSAGAAHCLDTLGQYIVLLTNGRKDQLTTIKFY